MVQVIQYYMISIFSMLLKHIARYYTSARGLVDILRYASLNPGLTILIVEYEELIRKRPHP
jgi:hypothetical protein